MSSLRPPPAFCGARRITPDNDDSPRSASKCHIATSDVPTAMLLAGFERYVGVDKPTITNKNNKIAAYTTGMRRPHRGS